MSARTTRLVVEREIREALRRKGIWALIAVVFLGATAMVVLPEVISGGPDDATIAVVGDDDIGLAEALAAVPDRELDTVAAADREAAGLAVEDGEADLAVLLDASPPTLLVEDESSTLVTIVREVVANAVVADQLTERGIDAAQVRDAFTAASPDVELIDVEASSREGAAFGVAFVLYLLTVVLTGQVASGVAIEKSNRVSEVLLAIVPPRSMLYGKVLGIGGIGLLTLLAAAIPVIVRFALGGDLPEGLGWTLAVSAVFFLGGLALYLTLAGSLGALVSRQEEAGAVVTPLTMLIVVGFLVALSAADSLLGTVLAYVPLLSPMLVPYRVAIGVGSPVEYVVSLAILLATVAVVGRIGAVVFRRAIVRTGRRLTLRDVL